MNEPAEFGQLNVVIQQFFNTHPSSNKIVNGIKQKIFNQHQQNPFIQKFVNYAGYPVWDKAIVLREAPKKFSSYNHRNGDNSQVRVVYIPLALDSQQNVNSILKASIISTDTVLSMLYHWQYKKYGYGESDTANNANETALLFMGFEDYVFGHSEFKINDRLLFKKNDTSGRTTKVKITSFNEPGENQLMTFVTITVCYQKWIPDGWLVGTPPGENNSGAGQYENICNSYTSLYDDGAGSYDGPEGETPSGGGGSGGYDDGSGDSWEEDPCNTMPSGKVEPCGGAGGGGTAPGWEPLPFEDDRNANGYLYTRISELQQILEDFPHALEPCDSLNIMPLETYGPMWQNVAQYTAPQSVIDRIDSIRNVTSGWIVDDYNIQSLSDAYGAIVNCDYFPVRITQMPAGYTPKTLLEYFRTHINSFIDPELGMSFGPYNGDGFDDTQKYNAPYEASLGSLWSIDLDGNDGSVLQSGYTNLLEGAYQSHYFTVSTIETPLDLEHPVAGNRRWGIFSNPDHPTEFTFYTMGVDRTWDIVFDWGNDFIGGFAKADALWSSLQSKMIQFISNNGGSAAYYSKPAIIARPFYAEVEKYLKGEIDFPELKRRLGC